MLPHREEILEGLLNSNIIGFHIYDYARHFLVSCEVLLSAECTPTNVSWKGRKIGVASIPIGIDQSMIIQVICSSYVGPRRTGMRYLFKGADRKLQWEENYFGH